MAVKNGKIHHMPKDKRFFFIRDEDGAEFFCHEDALLFDVRYDQITTGDVVSFVPVDGKKGKGPRAESVVVKRLEPNSQLLLDALFKK
jgi:cold shock CspA family protein